MGTLKSYRENELRWYILAYLLLVIYFSNPELFALENIDLILKIEKLFASVLLSGVICSLSFVLDSLYSSQMKDMLLFLGFTKAPGKVVFTRIKANQLMDERFENSVATKKYVSIICGLPDDKKQRYLFENTNWYKLYSRHKTDGAVFL